jgi:hypothetical protein
MFHGLIEANSPAAQPKAGSSGISTTLRPGMTASSGAPKLPAAHGLVSAVAPISPSMPSIGAIAPKEYTLAAEMLSDASNTRRPPAAPQRERIFS